MKSSDLSFDPEFHVFATRSSRFVRYNLFDFLIGYDNDLVSLNNLVKNLKKYLSTHYPQISKVKVMTIQTGLEVHLISLPQSKIQTSHKI